MDMIKEKIAQAVEILKEKNIDVWLTFVRESSTMPDPAIDMIIGQHATWQTAWIITRSGETIAIAGSLDVESIKHAGHFEEIVPYVQGIGPQLMRVLDYLKPKKIAINYSMDSVVADGLTHGMYLQLMEYLKGTKYEKRIVSSQDIISALRGRKSQSEIAKMKKAIKLTLDIYDQVTGFLRPGKSEQNVADFIMKQVRAHGVELAWSADHCPAVFTGPDHAGAHFTSPCWPDEGWHGAKFAFAVEDEGYCSDLQRTWYVRRKGETAVPSEVQRGFNVIRDSIKMAAEYLKPGVVSWKVDEIARRHIVRNGFPEYPHALGHQVGRVAHDGGVGLLPRWERYGKLPFGRVEEGQVFTIEPRLPIPGYGVATIEEIVWVTREKTVFLSKPQTKLYVV